MPDEASELPRAARWVDKAEGDFTAAVHLLTLPDDRCPFDVVCFHAHQCVEKYIKAMLVSQGLAPPRTHDLAELAALLSSDHDLPLAAADLGVLTPYAVETR